MYSCTGTPWIVAVVAAMGALDVDVAVPRFCVCFAPDMLPGCAGQVGSSGDVGRGDESLHGVACGRVRVGTADARTCSDAPVPCEWRG